MQSVEEFECFKKKILKLYVDSALSLALRLPKPLPYQAPSIPPPFCIPQSTDLAKFILIRIKSPHTLNSTTFIPRPKQVKIYLFVLRDALILSQQSNTPAQIYLFFTVKQSGHMSAMARVKSHSAIPQVYMDPHTDLDRVFVPFEGFKMEIEWIAFKKIHLQQVPAFDYRAELNDYRGANVITIGHQSGKVIRDLFLN
ncbi:hypothetical protein FGO68_gene17804 [Halteria grandinella]|uniref:YTH domain-containing protein n=1 Tax=Halteria grandinella TaxID=5974 RepID=A0A8J8T5D8_HALGN|nr:hypothetical protein FGO68_gene17804 [Halteria grandinella]